MTLFNHLSRLLPDLASPIGLVLALLLVAVLAGRRARLRGICLVAGVTVLIVFSLPLTSKTLIASLEDRYPALEMEAVPEADVIILLGGAVNLPHGGLTRPELGPSGDRLALATALWHAGKAPKILISAGNLVTPAGLSAEAVYTADMLESWGVPREAMVLETASGNTYENARESMEKISKAGTSTEEPVVLLVTSAFHMPRARALFCAAGLDTVAVTANHWLSGANDIGWNNWLPQAISFAGSTRVVREYLGMVVYHFLGRIDLGALGHDQPCSASQA